MQKCRSCGSSDFRLSRLRVSDFTKLIIFHYPIRCLRCRQRSFAPFSEAFAYRRRRPRKA